VCYLWSYLSQNKIRHKLKVAFLVVYLQTTVCIVHYVCISLCDCAHNTCTTCISNYWLFVTMKSKCEVKFYLADMFGRILHKTVIASAVYCRRCSAAQHCMVITFANADPPSCNEYVTEVDQTGKLCNVFILQCSLLRTKVMVSVKEAKRLTKEEWLSICVNFSFWVWSLKVLDSGSNRNLLL
jgi:hypothetical protein